MDFASEYVVTLYSRFEVERQRRRLAQPDDTAAAADDAAAAAAAVDSRPRRKTSRRKSDPPRPASPSALHGFENHLLTVADEKLFDAAGQTDHTMRSVSQEDDEQEAAFHVQRGREPSWGWEGEG